jgi:hypothetical protein
MHGIVPKLSTRYDVEIAVMKEMHWSFSDYNQAPEDLIEEIMTRVSADAKWEHEKRKRDKAKQESSAAAQRARGKHR